MTGNVVVAIVDVVVDGVVVLVDVESLLSWARLVMLLAIDESSHHTERRSFDQMGLTNVAAEASRVEQVFASAHHQLVRLQSLAALGALFTATKQPVDQKSIEIFTFSSFIFYYFWSNSFQ